VLYSPSQRSRAVKKALGLVHSCSQTSSSFNEPGALVPALECFDAASKGSVEACWTTAGFHTGKYPALAFFSTVPFGPQYGEFFAWKIYGGGDDLQNEIYGQHGLIKIDCSSTGLGG
jgi:TRAP-type mannitol/chloroaromatic compound transport system substrate-binding protein